MHNLHVHQCVIKNYCEWNGGPLFAPNELFCYSVFLFCYFFFIVQKDNINEEKKKKSVSYFMRACQNRNVNYMNLSEADSDHKNK